MAVTNSSLFLNNLKPSQASQTSSSGMLGGVSNAISCSMDKSGGRLIRLVPRMNVVMILSSCTEKGSERERREVLVSPRFTRSLLYLLKVLLKPSPSPTGFSVLLVKTLRASETIL